MGPSEATVSTIRRTTMPQDPRLNDDMMAECIDNMEEERANALIRIQNYQQLIARYYDKKVPERTFTEGDLVLQKVLENTKEENAEKLRANREGPYQVMKIIKQVFTSI